MVTGADGASRSLDLPRQVLIDGRRARIHVAVLRASRYYATAIAVGPDLDSEHLVFRLQPDASVEGVVSDENNEPVQNGMVRLFQQAMEDGRQRTIPMEQGQTDDLGHFHIGHLAPGTYYLAVSAHPWYAQNSRMSFRRKTNNPDTDARAAQETLRST